jgi:hypothetical protein
MKVKIAGSLVQPQASRMEGPQEATPRYGAAIAEALAAAAPRRLRGDLDHHVWVPRPAPPFAEPNKEGTEREGVEVFTEATHGPKYKAGPVIQVFLPSRYTLKDDGSTYVTRDGDLWNKFCGDRCPVHAETYAPAATPGWFSAEILDHLDSLAPSQQHVQVTIDIEGNGASPLYFAITCGCNSSVIKRMLEIAPEVASRLFVTPECSWYPLHAAGATNDVDIVKLLVRAHPAALLSECAPAEFVEVGRVHRFVDMLEAICEERDDMIDPEVVEVVRIATEAYERGDYEGVTRVCRTREEMVKVEQEEVEEEEMEINAAKTCVGLCSVS